MTRMGISRQSLCGKIAFRSRFTLSIVVISMLACSTSWNSSRHDNGETMIAEILSLGFDAIELGHGLKAHMLQGVMDARKSNPFIISGLHNFCPLPVEVTTDSPDCYEFTSHRKTDRERAVRQTLLTIDWAERFGAGYVVIHAGRIRSLNLTSPLRKMVRDGLFLSRKFTNAKLKAVQKRESLGELYMERALDCLTEIADYASAKGIRLGIENREHYEAVPSERELLTFLRRLEAINVGYWHDFGHAQIKHNLALIDHAEWLAQAGPQAIGCHLHDVRWPFEDHCPPFTGEIDYETLVPMLPPNCPYIFELSPRCKEEDVKKSLTAWRERFGK